MPATIEEGLRVDTIHLAFDAAARGLGVVLGRRPLVDDDLASGRLVPLVDDAVPSGNGYWLVTPQTEFQKPEVKCFRQWLLEAVSRQLSAVSPVPVVGRTDNRQLTTDDRADG